VALNIDTARALRTQEQLGALVRAVAAASPGDESRAVEWKSGYPDLGDAHASFAIARAVLGLANRPVSVAQSIFEGVGYVVVGAEPGRIVGQAMPDNADILAAISRYAGRSFPLWDPRSVEVDGRQVLVVTVEPPRAGDRIALLQKSYQPPEKALVAEGTIFVRHPGATERASRLDIEQLQDRLLDGTEAATAAARAEDQRRELRDLLADTVEAGNAWFSAMQVLVIMSASDWKEKDWIEWVSTDSGKKAAADAQLIHRNTRKMRLLGAPEAVLTALDEAEAEMSRANDFDGIHSKHPSTPEARATAYQHLKAVKARFTALEAAGIAALQPGG
jgi:hypothetical protein